jgi:hypothetical protein
MVDLSRLERLLVAAAREARPVTYGQLLGFFGRKVTRITVGALCRDLGAVCREVEARGGPDLAVLVVRKSDGLPGSGYFTSLRSEQIYTGPETGPEALAFVRNRQAAVFAYYANEGSNGPEAVVRVHDRAHDQAARAEHEGEDEEAEDGDLAIEPAEARRPERFDQG